MLKSLYIENIAVIEKACVNFGTQFNVLTGETGAGKSIIIDAINAVLGERTSKELIRAGCKNAIVTAVFSDLSENIKDVLEENGYLPDENNEYVIQRILSNTASNIKINGQPVSASVLRTFSNRLINIHGQHDNQALLQSENHYKYLDMLAENKALLDSYLDEFNNFNHIRNQLKKLDMDEDEKLRKIDLLKYQIAELEQSEITVGEYAALKDNLSIAKDCEKHKKRISEVLLLLDGNDNNDGILSQLYELNRIIQKDDFSALETSKVSVEASYEALCLFKDKAEKYGQELSSGVYELEKIRDRLEILNSLMRKYGNSEEEMLEFLDNARVKLKEIEFNDDEVLRLEKELELSQNRLIKLADDITSSRSKAAQNFEKEVSDILCELNMPNVKIRTEINKGRYTRVGCDEIQFLLSANAGEDLKPLSKVASGGELSRIMLAIKSVLSSKDDVDTLIFDEIDSGISGMAADKVAIRLNCVAKERQVLCVTHLAQIAAVATHHYLIKKSVSNGRTFTDVKQISNNDRVMEIARIMGGSNITEALVASAKEMLNNNASN